MSENQTVEMETVTIKLPKAIIDFLRGYRENIEEYLEYSILSGFVADIESCQGPFGDYLDILEKFKLEPVFKAYDVCYCKPKC